MEPKELPQLDAEAFTLSSCDPVKIVMPKVAEVTEDDIDAQLFSYVAMAGKGSKILGLADLDDEWVKSTFADIGIETIDALRASIKEDLEKQMRSGLSELKTERCSEALAARLVGDIPSEVIDAYAESMQGDYRDRLKAMGVSRMQYLASKGMSDKEFEEEMRADVEYRLRLDMALAKMAEALGVSIEESDLPDYLACEDPDRFLEEVRASGRVEDARRAAARVKVMRDVIEQAIVEERDEG